RSTLLVDAYCGVGYFAKHLSKKFGRVIGIDWDINAVRAASEDATSREKYEAGNVDDLLGQALASADPRAVTVIVDPPAVGLSPDVRRVLLESLPGVLIYVSCNPATLARDLAQLGKRYLVDSVTPFDMFPQTAEIEVIVHLRLAEPSDAD